MKAHAKTDTTSRSARNRPLRTISLSPEAWDMLDEIASDELMSRSGVIEFMVYAAHARRAIVRFGAKVLREAMHQSGPSVRRRA